MKTTPSLVVLVTVALGSHVPEGLLNRYSPLRLAPPGVNNLGNYRFVRVIYLRSGPSEG
jgi:hypothetical protein